MHPRRSGSGEQSPDPLGREEDAPNLGLQAVDLFSWGIFRKHERNDVVWFNVFRDKVRRDDRYL